MLDNACNGCYLYSRPSSANTEVQPNPFHIPLQTTSRLMQSLHPASSSKPNALYTAPLLMTQAQRSALGLTQAPRSALSPLSPLSVLSVRPKPGPDPAASGVWLNCPNRPVEVRADRGAGRSARSAIVAAPAPAPDPIAPPFAPPAEAKPEAEAEAEASSEPTVSSSGLSLSRRSRVSRLPLLSLLSRLYR
jgi:hypothetical protein